jgi:hypothetical protein
MKCDATHMSSSSFECDFENGQPIPFSREVAQLVQSVVQGAMSSEQPYKYPLPKKIGKFLGGEIKRFIVALVSYYQSPNPVMPLKFLLDGILEGEAFIKLLKKAKNKAYVNYINGTYLAPDDETESIPLFEITDIGDIFNYRYWFFWDQVDEQDWKHCFTPQKKVSEHDLKVLFDKCLEILPDELPESVQEEEILLGLSSSSSLEPGGNSGKVWESKQRNNSFTNKPLHGKMSYLQKCPGDTRNSITLSVPHSNTIKLIERQIAIIAADIHGSNYVKEPSVFEHRFKKFRKKFNSFLCRDLKKDGLTKVRCLVQTVLAAIKQKYPDLPACKYFDVFSDFTFTIDGELKRPPRGVGLGMSSAITTILQIALVRITQDLIFSEGEGLHEEMGELTYHDDIALGFIDESDLHTFDEWEDLVFEKYQQIKNKKKSFSGDGFVLCEHYGNKELDRKISYQCYVINLPYTAINISHAKELFLQSFRYVKDLDWEDYITELVEHFGYEFYPDEIKYPYSMGGWLPSYYLGVDVAFATVQEFSKECIAAMHASRTFTYRHKTKYSNTKRYYAPVYQIYGNNIEIPDKKGFLAEMSVHDVAQNFRRLDIPGRKNTYWRYQRAERLRVYLDHKHDPVPTIPELYRLYCNLNKLSDILPPRTLCVYDSVDHYEVVDKLYRPANPWLSYLKYFNPDKIRDSVIPWPLPPGTAIGVGKQLTADERRMSVDVNQLLHPNLNMRGFVGSKEILDIKSMFYYDPNNVLNATEAFYGTRQLPRGIVRDELIPWANFKEPFGGYLNNNSLRQLVNRCVHSFGYKRAVQLDYEIVVDELQLLIIAKTQLENQLQRRRYLSYLQIEGSEIPSSQYSDLVERQDEDEWSDSPLTDDQLFLWISNRKPYKDWRYRYFCSINDKMMSISALRLMIKPGEAAKFVHSDLPEYLKLDEVERHLFISSGGKTVDGYPNIDAADSPTPSGHRELERMSDKSSSAGSAVWDPFGENG